MSIAANSTALASDALKLRQTVSFNHMGGGMGTNAYSDVPAVFTTGGSGTDIVADIDGYPMQIRAIASDWAAADGILGIAVSGAYLYALLYDAGTTSIRLYRYDKTNIAAGGTQMTVATQAFSTTSYSAVQFTIDSASVFYFTHKAGNSASAHVISKYTLSGTTITYSADVTCGATSANFDALVAVDNSGNIYGFNSSVDSKIRKYNSSGTLQATSIAYGINITAFFIGQLYVGTNSSHYYARTDLPT